MNKSHNHGFDNFCHNVAWLRKQHKLSKKEMAKRLGIGVGSLNKPESGTIPPNMTSDVLNNLCMHFNISLADQFGRRLGEDSSE